MKALSLLAAAAAIVALPACNPKPKTPEVLDTNPDPMANELANRAPVELPPAIKADKTMRCKDNSLLYVTFFEGNKLAFVRTEKAGKVNRLAATETGEPLTADGGWKMTGTPDLITITQPGKPSQTCKS